MKPSNPSSLLEASPSPSPSPSPYIAYVGIDWADQKHDICLFDPSTQTFELSVINSKPEAIADWVEGLRKRFPQGAITICTEQKRGPLIYALCKYEFFVIYPVNPHTVAKYRQAFAPSRAKADPTDAHILVELLRKHRDQLQAWQPSSAQLRSLQQLVESRRTLVAEKVRLTNRITAALKSYYPQVLDWFDDKDTQVFCDFLTQYPSLKSAQAASSEDLKQFFKTHHVVQDKTINRRLEQIKQGVVLTEDQGVVEPLQLLVSALIAQLKVLLPSIATFDTKIEALFVTHPDAALFAALPGAGPQAFGEQRSRFQSAQDLLRYAGIAPVKESSGQKSWVIGAGVAPNSSDKPLWNGHYKPANTRFGQKRFIRCNAKRGKRIKLRSVLWHSSGFALYSAAGKTNSLMMR
jgi:transposase